MKLVRTFRWTLAGVPLFLPIVGCSNGASDAQIAFGTPGQVLPGSEPGTIFIVEQSQNGNASQLLIDGFFWGRLVDVAVKASSDCSTPASQATFVTIMKDFVIREDIQSVAGIYELDTNPLTGSARLRLLTVCEDDIDDPFFVSDVLNPLSQNLTPIVPRDIDDLLTFTRAPRNSALVLKFNDLIDPATVTPETVRVVTGYPPNAPFEGRVLADQNYGNVLYFNGVPRFFPTRVIIDPTISVIEGESFGLPVNPLGFPPSLTTSLSNLAVRLPSKVDATLGQTVVLENRTGHPLATSMNGPVDLNGTRDVIRALRSGGNTATTGDVNNGFLFDKTKPEVIGTQPIIVDAVHVPNAAPCFFAVQDADVFAIDFTYGFVGCALLPKVGDVVRQGTTVAEVLPQSLPGPNSAGEVSCLLVRISIDPNGNGLQAGGLGEILTTYDPDADELLAPCFVRFSPTPEDPSVPEISTSAQAVVMFSEPMDPDSLSPFGSLTLTRSEEVSLATGGQGFLPEQFVVGRVVATPALTQYSFIPTFPLAHRGADNPPAQSEPYYLSMGSGAEGPTDLSGNPLKNAFPRVTANVLETEATERNGGFVLRFNRLSEMNNEPEGAIAKWMSNNSETPDANERPEIRGQFLYDINASRIRPRPVNRISAAADRGRPTVGAMIPIVPGFQTPLVRDGSKLQALWRHIDLGWSLLDESLHNVDVEGLAWSPSQADVVPDTFPSFEIRLSHSNYFPDETPDIFGFPLFPLSGLIKTYTANELGGDPPKVVHPRGNGYTLDPIDTFLTAVTATKMMPFPLNRNIPTSDFKYYTYRDTAIQTVAAPNGAGVDPAILPLTGGDGSDVGTYAANAVPSIGLPLLMEFRCYPTNLSSSGNLLDVSMAIGTSAQPNFRAFSDGGVNATGTVIQKNPDTETQATGGYAGGVATPGNDNTFYIGNLDVVVRISRVHSIWFPIVDTEGELIADPTFAEPQLEPSLAELPNGTAITLAYRGATDASGNQLVDSAWIDFYGENMPLPAPTTGTPGMVSFPQGPSGIDRTWKSSISEIDGLSFMQFRLTFISNTQTGLTSELSTLAFTYTD